jgi:4-hydroxymandelate oxidase
MEETLRGDLAAWEELWLRPRALVDVSSVDTATTVAGQRVGPVAPGRYWQQLYFVRDRDVVADVVARAVSAGASALCLTVDLPLLPTFPGRMGAAAQAIGEHWGAGEHSMSVAREYGHLPFGSTSPNPGVSWSNVEWLRGQSDLPLILKGIVRPDDAVLARDHGAAAVVVSNHAGQGLRWSEPVAHALPSPSIVDAVGGDIDVLADSGIRTGSERWRSRGAPHRRHRPGRCWRPPDGESARIEAQPVLPRRNRRPTHWLDSGRADSRTEHP